jgi:hypothetical protein
VGLREWEDWGEEARECEDWDGGVKVEECG